MVEPVRNAWVNGLLVVGAILVSGGALALLHQLAPSVRRWIIAVLTLLAGLYFPLEFFIPHHNFLTPWRDSVADFGRLMAAFTFGLGIINLLLIHGRHLLRWTSNAPFSLAFFSGFFSDRWQHTLSPFTNAVLRDGGKSTSPNCPAKSGG